MQYIVLIILLVAVVPMIGLYIMDRVDDPDTFFGRIASKMREAQENTERGYVGIIGTLVTLIGIFMPCASVWGIEASWSDYLQEENSFFLFATMILLLVEIVLYAKSYNRLGCIIALGYGIFFAIGMMPESSHNEYSFNSIVEKSMKVEIGFWVMCLGLLLMIASPILRSANERIADIVEKR